MFLESSVLEGCDKVVSCKDKDTHTVKKKKIELLELDKPLWILL